MKMRAAGITLLSVALTAAVIANAYYHKQQFYPTVVYITQSNPSMAVMYLQASILVYLAGKLMRRIFFGELRAAEFEHLMERSWYAITETCLAFTVFRDDFSPKFVALFTLLLFLKCFHWLAEDRVDFMERSPLISVLFHVRVVSLMVLLGALDLIFIAHAYNSTVTKGASVQLVFGFEYAILATVVVNTAIKYVLHTVELTNETPWENKAVFLLYTELLMGLIKVFLYVTFVTIMIRLYTLPLFAFRPMYHALRKFKQAYSDVILSRRAIQNMNTLYPDATPEELAAADNVCIICREEMTTASKKLPCNHIFHTACLRSWFQRQQTCPTCRLNILRPVHQQQQTPQQPQQQDQPAPEAGGAPPLPPRPAFPFWPPQQPGVFGLAGVPPMGPVPAPEHHRPAAAAAAAAAGAAPAPQPRPPQDSQQGAEQAPQPGPSMASSPDAQPIPPPFLFPSMWGMVPPMPPIPPADFAGLSDEQLRQMEGTTRESLIARLQSLRHIELLLAATNTVMNQYMTVYNSSPVFSTGTYPDPIPSTSNATDAVTTMPMEVSSSTTKDNLVQQQSSSSSSDPSSSNTGSSSQDGAISSNCASEQNDELQRLRSKRLEKLEGSI